MIGSILVVYAIVTIIFGVWLLVDRDYPDAVLAIGCGIISFIMLYRLYVIGLLDLGWY